MKPPLSSRSTDLSEEHTINHPIRTRALALRFGAIAFAAGLLVGCSSSGSTVAGATCPKGTSIAFMGRFDGVEAAQASPTERGAALAVDEFNAANPGCQITLDVHSGAGGADAAATAAQEIVAAPRVVAVVGPQFSGDVEKAGPVLDAGGVPFVSATATRTDLSARGWKMFHRIVGTNESLGTGAAHHALDTLNAGRIAVIDDGTPYSIDLAATVTRTLGDRASVVGGISDDPASIAAVVSELADFGPGDAVFFAGYERSAAALLHALRAAGNTSTFMGSDTLLSAAFLDAAGDEAEGVLATCQCAPLSKIAGGEDFATRFRASFPDVDPNDEYAAEAFDATNLILSTIAAGNHDRAALADALSSATWEGITRTIHFDTRGDVMDPVVWISEVRGGSFQPLLSVNGNG